MNRLVSAGWLLFAAVTSTLVTAAVPVAAADGVDSAEAATLQFMREEEKVARDVYRELYAAWGKRVFANISASEQQHMGAIYTLLRKYAVPDPVVDDSTGAFTNADLAYMFTELSERGRLSLVEGLKVGMLIEETDIVDLQNAINETDNLDIRNVYSNLLNGSFHHLAAFARNQRTAHLTSLT